MLNRFFGKPKQEAAYTLTTLDKLNETLEMLEKKEKGLMKKADAEVEKAKEFAKARNKRDMVSMPMLCTNMFVFRVLHDFLC
ncbi:hypothetical protein HRI_002237700 [Hibiscus trionum]|uniref:Uncharacterized protein n=1 Tax=Hibiscus trionum TaxID=183268 RepID=A0A9W7M2K2_HIBTR|nr:hypothetical protein HRI_002237700 [Hibiscus trionum]